MTQQYPENEHKKHMNNLNSTRYSFMRQVEQQCASEGNNHLIGNELQKLTTRTRSTIERIDDYKVRLEKMQHGLRHGITEQNVDSEIDIDVKNASSRRALITSQCVECPFCSTSLLRQFINDHLLVCVNRKKNGGDKTLTEHTKFIEQYEQTRGKYEKNREQDITVRPLPPRNLKVTHVGFDIITLGWDEPIFDGGEPLIDYRLIYTCMGSEPKISLNQSRRERDNTIHNVLCSRWCLKSPIPQHKFTLEGLHAATEYKNIKLQCKNRIGWSDYSSSIDLVRTADPIIPSPPQRFAVKAVTSHSIDLIWSVPFHYGGGRLLEYELKFFETTPNDEQTAGKKYDKTKLESRTLRIAGDKLSFQLSRLPGDTTISCLHLRAVNHFGTISNSASCGDTQTLQPLEVDRIKMEIERVKDSSNDVIDTDFFQEGVQRQTKSAYLFKLEHKLRDLDSEAIGISAYAKSNSEPHHHQDSLSSNIGKLCESNEKSSSVEEQNYDERRRRFEYRINVLKSEINKCKNTHTNIIARRVFLTFQLEHLQERITVLRIELVRISSISDTHIASNIISGSKQNFSATELRKLLEEELNNALLQLATFKDDIIRGDQTLTRLLDEIKRKDASIQERIIAYKLFKKRVNSVMRARQIISQHPEDIIKYYFSVWLLCARKRKSQCSALNILCRIHKHWSLVSTIYRWKMFTIVQSPAHSTQRELFIISKGGTLLLEAEIARKQNIDLLAGVMNSVSNTQIQNTGNVAKYTDFHSYLSNEDSLSMLKGNFYADIGHNENALHCFKSVLHYSRDANTPITLQCTLLEKMSNVYLKSKSWNSAIMYLEHLQLLAKEIKSNQFIAVACLHLGECYSEMGEYRSAKEYYMRALLYCNEMCQASLELKVHLGLHFCHKQLDDIPRALQSKDRYEALLVTPKKYIASASEKLDKLQERLVNVTASCGSTIYLQKATNMFVRAKDSKKKLKSEIKNKKVEIIGQTRELERLRLLISKIKSELNTALKDGKTSMPSSLIHESTQNFETSELLERLKVHLENSTNELTRVDILAKSLNVEVKNLDDDLRLVEQDIKLEEGALMQTVLSNRLIRCMALNSSNTNSNNVTGGAVGGIAFLALTIEKDLFVHSIDNGRLEYVFVGDNFDSHFGKVTGHTSIITCIFFCTTRIYTGSMDKSIICWDIDDNNLHYIARGHRATVTCIHVYGSRMVSGSADTSIFLWNSDTGEILKHISGHSCGVSCILGGPTWYISGDINGEIFVWCEEFNCIRRLNSNPQHKLTVIRYGKLELISGNSGGFISIWWVKSGAMTQQCKAHDGPINDLQFDATKLVSCGMDCLVKVIDIITCQVLQSLRGHDGPILSIAFDNRMIITLSRDGTFRQWPWGSKLQPGAVGDTLHTVTAGESISVICQKYSISLLQIIKWNKSKDTKHLLPGQTLIVKKIFLEGHKDENIGSDAWQLHTNGGSLSDNPDDIKEIDSTNENETGLSPIMEDGKVKIIISSNIARKKYFDFGGSNKEQQSVERSTLAFRLRSYD